MAVTIDATWIPSLVSEREPDGSWEDCTWASGVMLANAGAAGDWHPGTRAEYEALRVAGGDGPAENPHDGSNLGQLAVGMRSRYGWTGARADGWTAVSAVRPRTAVVVTGSYASLPTHFRRWDPAFGGGHAALAVRTPYRWWWLDPLAVRGYAGEEIAAATLGAFVRSIGPAMAIPIGKEARMDIAHKIERWILDGGPGNVTTLGAPRVAGVMDWSRRLAFVSGSGGVDPRLELIARSRLTEPSDELDEELRAALAAYQLIDPVATDKLARIAAVLEG